jgi:thioredoxin reductase
MTYHDYIIIGAGPGGVQMGYFLEQAGRDYLILEGGHAAAMFFSQNPRHRRLNSFNKRFNWFPEPEFNLRFDWNSLLTHDYSFSFRPYSEDLYPLADDIVRYINDYIAHFHINVQYHTRIGRISRDPETKLFVLAGNDGNEYRSKVLIMATGPVKPNIPDIEGIEHVEGYEDHDTGKKRYEGKRVVILGQGNSAFEVANHLVNSAAVIQILPHHGRGLRHAWQTHYVGDVRAAGNALLDMSQLKLLHSVQGIVPTKIVKQADGTLRMFYKEEFPHWKTPGIATGSVVVDFIIRCTGWKYLDAELFDESARPQPADNSAKYPWLSPMWETTVPDLYYAGAAMEGRNRRSPTGFIHGYRYTVRALHRLLEEKNEGVASPREEFDLRDADDLRKLGEFMVKRLSTTSGLYEAYGIMSDTLVFDNENKKATLVYELPADQILASPKYMDKKIMLFTLEYGFQNFPDADPNSFVRRNDPERPGCVAYLHPVFRYYENGQFVKGRNIRSSSVVRYDPSVADFDGDFGLDKPRHVIMNFVNEVAKVTPEIFSEDHFTENEVQGGFREWPADKPLSDNTWLPQCALSTGDVQVRDFDHRVRMMAEAGEVVGPWVHTM